MYRVFASRALRAKSLCDKSSTSLASLTLSRLNHSIPFATVDAEELSGAHPAEVQSFGMSLLLTDCALTLWK
jgi:1-pyrroline-5-carboxylate dehydrogenase